MSNVVSPRGPLPPRIYWRRRLVLLAVVVGLVLLVGRLFGGGDDGADTQTVADRGSATPADPRPAPGSGQAAPRTAPGAAGADTARKPATTRGSQGRVSRAEPSSVSLSGPTGPLAQPEGTCEASEVAVVPDVEDTDASAPVPVRLGLSALGDKACTFAFGPETVALRITSGDDLIWESLKCSEALDEQSVVVRPGWLTYVTVTWSGRRGEGCATGGDFADPGYYWAEAASLGGEPDRSQFELETPPPPEPEPKKSEQDGEAADEQATDEPRTGETPSDRQSPTAEETPTDEPSTTDRQAQTDRQDQQEDQGTGRRDRWPAGNG